jgi:transposase
MNALSMNERNKIIGLLNMGWTQRQIERETGHRRETIARIGREAGLLPPKCTAGGEVPTDSKAAKVATDSGRSRSSCEPFRDVIEAELAKGCHGVSIYQHLVDHHGYDGAYNAVKRFVSKLRPSEPEVKCRFETPPGQEAQVDYGEGAPTRHPRTGKYRRPRLFVMTLGMSRRYFPKTIWSSSKQLWCQLHEEAFAYYGGATRIVRPDNLKEGVIDADVYDPEINELFAAMLAHYGVIPFPCRPNAPDEKGKVESGIHHVQRALKGKRFESTDEQNVWLLHWNETWADTRIHGTTKRQVRAMFEEERPHLLPLPTTRFEYYDIAERRVHLRWAHRSPGRVLLGSAALRWDESRRSYRPAVAADPRSSNASTDSRTRRYRAGPAANGRRRSTQTNAAQSARPGRPDRRLWPPLRRFCSRR